MFRWMAGTGSCEKIDSPIFPADQKCLPMCRESLVGHLNAKVLLTQIGYSSEINFFTASSPHVSEARL